MILFLLPFLIAALSCQRNIFEKAEKPLTTEELAIKYLENKKPDKALETILNIIPPGKREALAVGSNVSPSNKKNILVEGLANHPKKDILAALYALAIIGVSGVDILKIALLVVESNEEANQNSSSADLINKLVQIIPYNEKVTDALDTALLIGDITPNEQKEVSRLSNEVIIALLSIVAKIIALDTNKDRSITEQEIKQLSPETAQTLFDLISYVDQKMGILLSRTQEKSYKKIGAKIADLKQKVTQAPGEKIVDKIQGFLVDLLSKTRGTAVSIDSLMGGEGKLFVSKVGDPRTPKKPIGIETSLKTRLTEKRDRYLALALEKGDEQGWITDTKCDGLLFNALFSLSGGNPDILKARDANKQWFRHPKMDCFKNGESKSTISRDMFVGLLLWIWSKQANTTLKELVSYGASHQDSNGYWIMGQGDETRVRIELEMQDLIQLMVSLMNKTPSEVHERVWIFTDDYAAHLEMLKLLLYAELRKGISETELHLAKKYAEISQRNALFQFIYHLYSDGNMDGVANILLDESLFPQESLPTNEQRCAFYLWERQQNEDSGALKSEWIPCEKPTKTVYSGVDFLFVSSLILGLIPNMGP